MRRAGLLPGSASIWVVTDRLRRDTDGGTSATDGRHRLQGRGGGMKFGALDVSLKELAQVAFAKAATDAA